MMISGFEAKDSNCPSTPWPPTNRVYMRSVNFIKSFITYAVWIANSLEGTIIKQRVPTTILCFWSLLIIGITKAAVLPLPVLEQATKSRP